MARFTDREKQEECERELRMRDRVYRRNGYIDAESQRRIAIMTEIKDEYAARVRAANPDLFSAPGASEP